MNDVQDAFEPEWFEGRNEQRPQPRTAVGHEAFTLGLKQPTEPRAGRPAIDGVTLDHHDASHHGRDESKIEQLALVEETELKLFSRFLSTMQQVKEADATLFDHTTILNVSNLGNASAHTCENLPVILAGGGFKHRGHVLKDRKDNTPLSNLYVRLLHQVGIEADAFGSSTQVMDDV